jgi:transglutaminase-like putative cysteine protease
MKIEAGYDISFHCGQNVPMLLMLTVHPERQRDLLTPHRLVFSPEVVARDYSDAFGNSCTRLVAPAGLLRIQNRFLIRDSGEPEEVAPYAAQLEIDQLPNEALVYLMSSRYCDTEKLNNPAWLLFGGVMGGWPRVQAICDYVHERIEFGYHHARGDRTAAEAHEERIGVCRDFAHLAIALCRCMNVPARYCTGYLGDIGVRRDPAPMDFSAWFEAFLDGKWYTFDARHNRPRIGRILIARGRDAADVAISTSFGQTHLAHFSVLTEEISEGAPQGNSGITSTRDFAMYDVYLSSTGKRLIVPEGNVPPTEAEGWRKVRSVGNVPLEAKEAIKAKGYHIYTRAAGFEENWQ